jgi:hypothetical protein
MTAIEWLAEQLYPAIKLDSKIIDTFVEVAKEMERKQIIDAAERWKGTDFAEKYYNETYGSKGSDECYFEPTTNTSSATICKHCGREKFMHTELQQINQDNPVTRGSTALVPTSFQTEISNAGKDTADYIDRHIIESMKELAREGFKPQIPEISDEEIEKEGWKYCYENKISSTNIVHWITACKWYREQLKQKP